MLGAICGDIVGSIYEFSLNHHKSKKFELFTIENYFTDDSVMTIAIADALLSISDYTEENVKAAVIDKMRYYGKEYPDAGYGGHFGCWLFSREPQPYNSFGNGSAMRVSPVGWMFDSLDKTLEVAKWTAEVTHNHEEGIKGAQATAAVIFLARTGKSKDEIKSYIEKNFYTLDKTCDEIRPGYKFDVSCMGTVPVAIQAFLEGKDFEDVIRTAVSLGGDCDTLTCIAGSMAEAFYKIPMLIKHNIKVYLNPEFMEVIDKFYKRKD